jgi:hypothetical protein
MPTSALPNLLIPGAGKSGTTSLHGYLNQHPDVFMSEWKEPHFFSNPEFFGQGLGEYAKLFQDAGDARIRGESSTTYLQFPDVIERIKASLPETSLIFMLRNPIDRIDSHYRWMVSLGLEDRPLRAALLADIDQGPTFNDRIGGAKFRFYFDESRYGTHLRRFLEAFDRSEVLVLTNEELQRDHMATLEKSARLLRIDPFPALPELRLNETRAQTDAQLSDGDRAWLRDLLSPEVQELRALTGQAFSEWEADFPLPAAQSASR